MLTIAFAISPYLLRYLEKSETMRQQILLYPIQPKRELTVQFAATVDRIYYGLTTTEIPVLREKIKSILANQIVFSMQKNPTKRDPIQTTVLGYKQSLDYIKREWTLNPDAVTVKDITKLYTLMGNDKLPLPDKQLQDVLTYLQASSDNAYAQAAIAKLLFRQLLPPGIPADIFSTLCSYLFLYKGGVDCRGLIVLEKPWSEDNKLFLGHYQTAIGKENITDWIEFYVKAIALHLEATYTQLSQTTKLPVQEETGKLNERQKTIMTLLEDPKAVITNRTVQKIFHISQITASRDLAKLTSLGLLFSHGKGRSVRYTRI
jgi:uncharacterized membrane protein